MRSTNTVRTSKIVTILGDNLLHISAQHMMFKLFLDATKLNTDPNIINKDKQSVLDILLGMPKQNDEVVLSMIHLLVNTKGTDRMCHPPP